MNKYQIIIEETLRRIVEVEEETPVLAVSRAEDEYNEQKYVLSADDLSAPTSRFPLTMKR